MLGQTQDSVAAVNILSQTAIGGCGTRIENAAVMNGESADDPAASWQVVAETVVQVQTAPGQIKLQGRPAGFSSLGEFFPGRSEKHPFATHVQYRIESGVTVVAVFDQVGQYLADVTGDAPYLAFNRLSYVQSDVHEINPGNRIALRQ